MANERLNIPQTLKVGFNERGDTYTGKLAYVTYVNAKGEIAKQVSWDGWRNKNIDVETYDNEPVEGFVLNRHAGGYKSGWNFRQSKCRVYDPRGFEFEITIENLLFILQECTSTRGKGLEGKFVYAWSGPDLVLLPVDSEDYRASTNLINKKEKLTVKTLKLGASYKGRDDDYLIYIGKMDWYVWSNVNVDYGRYYRKLDKVSMPTFVSTNQNKFMGYKNLDRSIDYLIEENVITPEEIENHIDNFKSTVAYKGQFVDKLTIGDSLEEWENYKNGKTNYRTWYGCYLHYQMPGDDCLVIIKGEKRKTLKNLEKQHYIEAYYPYRTSSTEERTKAGEYFDANCITEYVFTKSGVIRYEDGKLIETRFDFPRNPDIYMNLTDEDWKYISDSRNIHFTSKNDENDKIIFWNENGKTSLEIEFNDNNK
jgi:hypothetical protein